MHFRNNTASIISGRVLTPSYRLATASELSLVWDHVWGGTKYDPQYLQVY